MATAWSTWTWSEEHGKYYASRIDESGQTQYQWSDNQAQGQQEQTQQYSPRLPRSEQQTSYGATDLYNQRASIQSTSSQPNYDYGTGYSDPSTAMQQTWSPPQGQYSQYNQQYQAPTGTIAQSPPLDRAAAWGQLDSSYQVENYKFFKRGLVFSTLWTEPASPNASRSTGSTITTVTYGQHAFSNIRRFVVFSCPSKHHSICVSIRSYGQRGTLARQGIDANAHAIIYTGASAPEPLPGETLNKIAIQVNPEPGESLQSTSRVNCGKPYSVEHNLKVKKIGVVPDAFMAYIDYYYQEHTQGNRARRG